MTKASELGANIRIDDQRLVVEPGPAPDRGTIDCGLAGTDVDFLPPVAALSLAEVRFARMPKPPPVR